MVFIYQLLNARKHNDSEYAVFTIVGLMNSFK